MAVWPKSVAMLCLLLAGAFIVACGSKPTDPRTVLPADSLLYLETADLGRALKAVTSGPEFQRRAGSLPNFSAMDGISLSIAVTGFQTTEERLPDQNMVLNFKPRFVAVAETNAWNFQALSFTENQLGGFINEVYGGEVGLVSEEKHGGRYFTWTAVDGRKAFAFVQGSVIVFGNDEPGLENSVNILRGGGDSIASNPKVSGFSRDSLASGYVSKDGVAQLANIAAVSFAIDSGENADAMGFVAQVMPQIVRNSVTEAVWVSRKLPDGRVEDVYDVSLASDTAGVLVETITAGSDTDPGLKRFVPADAHSATSYMLKDARIAWRSVLLMTRTKVDDLYGNLLTAFSPAFFDPYGVGDGEVFLGSIESTLQTVRMDADGDEVAVIARMKDRDGVRRSVAKGLDLSRPAANTDGIDTWRTADGEISAAIVGDYIVIGESAAVRKCVEAHKNNSAAATEDTAFDSSAPIMTRGRDLDSGPALLRALTGDRNAGGELVQAYSTESRFDRNGLRRRTVSELGLIGVITAMAGSGS
ncbi:MAG: hypothetical protein AB7Q37_12340 [Pyrinomonadaceae bacterium]